LNARETVAALLMLSMVVSAPGLLRAADDPPAPPPGPVPAIPPAPAGAQRATPSAEVTPARVSYINGEVSFSRPGAQDWTPAQVNTPLAPGDALYTGQAGNVEIQVAPRAFVRAAEGTQLSLDNHEADFVQLRVTAGHAAVDLRELAAGHAVELDTPHAAFTLQRPGYYHVDVAEDSTTLRTHRGGGGTMTPAVGMASPIVANQQMVIEGGDSPRVEVGAAPDLTAWDRWNYQRSDYLLQPAGARYVSPTVYGTADLNQYGAWRTVETYGAVWVPASVSPGWVPYSTGRWIWDPRFGWTWLDTAPWGWAPYHYGRWVFVGNYWAWAPGPVVVRPVYAPALVVFLGGGVRVSVGGPLYWAPLGWGEPIIPWWGRPGFVGVAWWGGWGGPRVVNNVVVNRTTVVNNVTNITVYRNVHVTNAVVGVPADRFGHGPLQVTRASATEVRQFTPVRGALEVRPSAASLTPASGPAARPPAALQTRQVVATRAPHDFTPTLRREGVATTAPATPAATPRLVPAPRPSTPRVNAAAPPERGPNAGGASDRGARRPNVKQGERADADPGRGARQAPPPPPAHEAATSQRQQDGRPAESHGKRPAEPRANRERPEQRPDR